MADKIVTKSRRVCVPETLTICNYVKSLYQDLGLIKL